MKPIYPAKIIHCKIDRFLASVAEADEPSLKSKPLAIIGRVDGQSVVMGINELASAAGIYKGLAANEASRRCPFLIMRSADLRQAKVLSARFFNILLRFSDQTEPCKLDEAFIDSGESFGQFQPMELAASIQRVINLELGLNVSLGVARNKTAAWAAAHSGKPNRIVEVKVGTERAWLYPLPLSRLFSLGARTRLWLEAQGVKTIGQLARLPQSWLRHHFSDQGLELQRQALGLADEPIHPWSETKTISRTLSFDQPNHSADWLRTAFIHLLAKATSTLSDQGRRPGLVSIRLQKSNRSRQRQLRLPNERAAQAVGVELFERLIKEQTNASVLGPTLAEPIRSITVSFGALASTPHSRSRKLWQLDQLQSALTNLHRRFGHLGDQLTNQAQARFSFSGG